MLAIVGKISLYLQGRSKISSEKPKNIIKQIDNKDALYSKCLFSVKFNIDCETIETTKNTVAGTIPNDSGLLINNSLNLFFKKKNSSNIKINADLMWCLIKLIYCIYKKTLN